MFPLLTDDEIYCPFTWDLPVLLRKPYIKHSPQDMIFIGQKAKMPKRRSEGK